MKNNSSETKCSAFYCNDSFKKWFVGVTDGDGCFHFREIKPGVWNFTFKIGQSVYNLRLLYYIKSMLGVGSITICKENAEFRIRNRQHIIKYIIPIFDEYSLLTSKYFNYKNFKEAILILDNPSLSKEEKDIKIKNLNNLIIPDNYISPIWNIINNKINNLTDVKKMLNKNWLIGFTEAEGSFYITKKGPKRFVHAFEITQKLDKIVQDAIGLILNIKVINKKTYYTIVTTKTSTIKFIIDYFHKTMKGMKSLEFRIWARSFKNKEDFNVMYKTQILMRKIRSIKRTTKK